MLRPLSLKTCWRFDLKQLGFQLPNTLAGINQSLDIFTLFLLQLFNEFILHANDLIFHAVAGGFLRFG